MQFGESAMQFWQSAMQFWQNCNTFLIFLIEFSDFFHTFIDFCKKNWLPECSFVVFFYLGAKFETVNLPKSTKEKSHPKDSN